MSWQTGFRDLATYFGTQGYTKAELYATTWGAGKLEDVALNNHAKSYVLMLREFVEAVLAYTKAPQVTIISHSMGVTLARKVVQGGVAEDSKEGGYQVGPSLKSQVKQFVGLAGANLGLAACINEQYTLPTCSSVDGFFPGEFPTSGPSTFLKDINKLPSG